MVSIQTALLTFDVGEHSSHDYPVATVGPSLLWTAAVSATIQRRLPRVFMVLETRDVSQLRIAIHDDRPALGRAAAAIAAGAILDACRDRGSATLVVATGSSQFEVLAELTAGGTIPWDRVTLFHLDEYVGLEPTHPASFRRFLRERFIDRLPMVPAAFHGLDGTSSPRRGKIDGPDGLFGLHGGRREGRILPVVHPAALH